ncbi:twin-arginine translocation pathway signal [Tardiphaga alba]|uniref:Twin-arginine translocation pathway signal n=1 Tax=Tardiphaga alba TaxID=340268 RepID=A0ABX8AFP7_9BRAD|nr:esterase-like activity of phytase family protein [Tardiphaga alba]QUS42586.1 twin-arginine translocation pathway signal [Tardiphaga alba]
MLTRRSILASLAATAAIPALARAQSVPVPAPASAKAAEKITIDARPVPAFDTRDPQQTRFGSLQYRSGLVLTSKFRDFGGISALRLDDKGERFVALSDKGMWFTGKIAYVGAGMAGIVDAEAAPILGADGKPLEARGWFDSESLALEGGVAYVGFERVHQIVKFDFGRDGVFARGEPIPQPVGMRKLPDNKSLESLVLVSKEKFKSTPLAGMLLAISERGLDSAGNIQCWIIGGKAPATFSIRRTLKYDISDAALLPSGDLLLLERKFSLFGDTGIRIRRVPLASVAPNAVVDGPNILEADLGHEIDNFEGIDVHTADNGDTVLTLISDNNFSMLQRTLLMQFTLLE